MSRSTVAKSRADKGGKTTAAPTPAITHEIVPGKFTDQDWNLQVDQDDGCDFAIDLMEEICSSALDIIHKRYLERQLIPFTVLQAKDALLQVIEWQFLARDEGESDLKSQPGWLEDEEPAPAVTDCWAQGIVPRRLATPRSARSEKQEGQLEPVPEDPTQTSEEQNILTLSQVNMEEVEQEDAQKAEETQESKEGDADEMANAEESSLPAEEGSMLEEEKPRPPAKEKNAKRKRKFIPYSGQLSSEHLTKLTESLDETEMKMYLEERPAQEPGTPDPALLQMPTSCHSMLKLQAGRPPGNRDVKLDTSGNVIAVAKIDPTRLPTHKVKTGFQVVDPDVEAAQARLEAMRTGRHASTRRRIPVNTGSGTPRNQHDSRRVPPGDVKSQTTKSKHGITPLPPPLLETMEVSPGVVVREGDRVKHGPRQHPRRAELILASNQKDLRPVAMRATMPLVTVQQLLESQSPTIRPLSQTPPIPPIVPHPPSQAVGSR